MRELSIGVYRIALDQLHDHDGKMSLGELYAVMSSRKTNYHPKEFLRRLESTGAVESSLDDKVGIIVSLTEKGKAEVEKRRSLNTS